MLLYSGIHHWDQTQFSSGTFIAPYWGVKHPLWAGQAAAGLSHNIGITDRLKTAIEPRLAKKSWHECYTLECDQYTYEYKDLISY